MVDLGKPVRVTVGNTDFDVPLRYFYAEAIEKRGRWPDPAETRVPVDTLNISVLLPDMRGYFPEETAKWKERGPADRVQVSVMKPVGPEGWFAAARERSRADVATGRAKVAPAAHGLEVFDEGWRQVYFPPDGRETMITCQPAEPGVFPACSAKSAYRPGLVLSYQFGAQHLGQWRQIDDMLKALGDRLAGGRTH